MTMANHGPHIRVIPVRLLLLEIRDTYETTSELPNASRSEVRNVLINPAGYPPNYISSSHTAQHQPA